jgi:hypothetical protein
MADWQTKLILTDIWDKSSNETAETGMVPDWFVTELIKRLETLLEEIKKNTDIKIRSMAEDLEEIIIEITCMKSPEGIDKDDFKAVWDNLYDWADTPLDRNFGGKKMCWIATRF